MEKIVVTGVDRALGSNLAVTFAERFEVVGLYHEHPVELDGCETAALPFDNPTELGSLLAHHRPDWVIHCGPTSRNAWDAGDEMDLASEDSQLAVISALLGGTRALGARLTVMSTDAVFAGPRLFHEEHAPTGGLSWLGSVALRAEAMLEGTGAMVVRSHAYGWSPVEQTADFVERLWQDLTGGVPRRVDYDRHATPILASDLAELLERAYRQNIRGLLHLSGAERTSPFRMAAELAVAFGLNGRHVQLEPYESCSSPKLPLQETSLNTWRGRRLLKMAPPMLKEGLYRFADQASCGFRSRLTSSTSTTTAKTGELYTSQAA